MKAINSANLTTSRSCNITVETEAPDISGLNVNLLLASPKGHEVYTTENSKELGITWSGGKSDVEFYGETLFCYNNLITKKQMYCRLCNLAPLSIFSLVVFFDICYFICIDCFLINTMFKQHILAYIRCQFIVDF